MILPGCVQLSYRTSLNELMVQLELHNNIFQQPQGKKHLLVKLSDTFLNKCNENLYGLMTYFWKVATINSLLKLSQCLYQTQVF